MPQLVQKCRAGSQLHRHTRLGQCRFHSFNDDPFKGGGGPVINQGYVYGQKPATRFSEAAQVRVLAVQNCGTRPVVQPGTEGSQKMGFPGPEIAL